MFPNSKRADDYHTWFTFGLILKNLSPNFQCVWDHFSAKSSKFNQNVNDMKWTEIPTGNNKITNESKSGIDCWNDY